MFPKSRNFEQNPQPDVKAALLYFVLKSCLQHILLGKWRLCLVCDILVHFFKQQGSLAVRMVYRHKCFPLRALALFQPSVLEKIPSSMAFKNRYAFCCFGYV